MASRADLAAQRQRQADIVTLAVAALVARWESLDLADPAAVVAALSEAVPEIAAAFGETAASVAADFYDTLRREAGVPGAFTATMAAPVPDQQVANGVRYDVRPLFEKTFTAPDGDKVTVKPDPDKALKRLSTDLQRYVQQPARDTIARNAGRDPASAHWARVPTGPTTCGFCLVMASRAAVYESEGSAGADQDSQFVGDGKHKYHNDCDCVAIPVWSPRDYPEGYDPDALYDKYKTARDQVTDPRMGTDLNKILAQMRVSLGVK